MVGWLEKTHARNKESCVDDIDRLVRVRQSFRHVVLNERYLYRKERRMDRS
jgi:hypothetical protein